MHVNEKDHFLLDWLTTDQTLSQSNAFPKQRGSAKGMKILIFCLLAKVWPYTSVFATDLGYSKATFTRDRICSNPFGIGSTLCTPDWFVKKPN